MGNFIPIFNRPFHLLNKFINIKIMFPDDFDTSKNTTSENVSRSEYWSDITQNDISNI